MKEGWWYCPNPKCGKQHSKPHFAFPDQVDYTKQPHEHGRVKSDREWGCRNMPAADTPHVYGNVETGPEYDKHGNPNPLFCPHCGCFCEIKK